MKSNIDQPKTSESKGDDFKKAIVKFRRKNSVVLLLQRGDQGYYITINLGS